MVGIVTDRTVGGRRYLPLILSVSKFSHAAWAILLIDRLLPRRRNASCRRSYLAYLSTRLLGRSQHRLRVYYYLLALINRLLGDRNDRIDSCS